MGTEEVIREWLQKMYQNELDQVRGAIDNERIWRDGSTDPEDWDQHTENIAILKAYAKKLKKCKEEVNNA